MSLDPANQFNEAGTSLADFAAQDIVLANSPILSADVNTIAERAIRRTRYLENAKADLSGDTFTGPVIFDDTVETNGVVTANEVIVPVGTAAHLAPKYESVGNPSADFDLDETANVHSVGNPTMAVTATITFTGGGQPRTKRVYTRAASLAFEISFEQSAVGGVLAAFPPGGNKCWIDFVYNSLTWEVAGYGGGTVV